MNESNNQPAQDPEKDESVSDNKESGNQDSYLKNTIKPVVSPVAAAFIGLIGGFFLYQVVWFLITVLILGGDIKNAPANSLRLLTAAGQILFILLPALIFSKIFYEDVTTLIRAKSASLKEIALFLAGIIILTPLTQSYLYIQNHYIEILAKNISWVRDAKLFLDSQNEMVEKMFGSLLTVNNAAEGLLVIVVVSVIPALCEEVMFRGFIQRSFEFKIKPVWAALITAVFFGIYHFNPYGLIPLIGLGFYFGFAAYMSNSILIPIILHFFNNFTAVVAYLMSGQEDLIKSNPASTDFNTWVIIFFVLLFIFTGIIIMIKRFYTQARNT